MQKLFKCGCEESETRMKFLKAWKLEKKRSKIEDKT